MTAPLADATHRAIGDAINSAIRGDARVRSLIAAARSARTPEAFAAAVVEGGELLAQSEGVEVLGVGGCIDVMYQYASIEFPTDADGKPRPVIGSVRVVAVPGIAGRPLWVITDERDVEAMREAIEPGQVWVRSDLITADDWPRVRALAADAARRSLGQVRPPGRRKGSTNAARRAVLSQIRASPAMSDEAIDALGVEAGIWTPSLGDYQLVRQRATRARKDAQSIKS